MLPQANEDFAPDRARAADADARVPVIDIAAFADSDAAARRRVVDAVKQACEHVGFFVVTGHQVPDAVIRSAFTNGRTFFARPLEEKMRIARPGPGISRGYNSVAGQSLGLTIGKATPPDLMESLGFGPLETDDDPYWTEGYGPVHAHPNLWPQHMPGFRTAIGGYWCAMEALAMRLSRIFALALELDEEFFVRRSDRHVTNMRINYYPVQERPPENEQLRAGAHSDYGAFTILKGENAPGGLQVLRRGGDWADVPIIEEGFVINIGDLLMRWTNDKWVSTIHRVVNPPEEVRRNVDRMSIAFFFVPNHDIEVRCIESCTGLHSPPRYAPTTAGAHWRGKILAARRIGAEASASAPIASAR
jgi:isopenicillin N synthase-like dioxygenase